MARTGSMFLSDIHELKDISLHSNQLEPSVFPDRVSLRFLSIVETCRIPLYLSLGPPCAVTTGDTNTEKWFSHVLLANGEDPSPSDPTAWWRNAASGSPFGILAAIEAPTADCYHVKPHATEVLFYGSRGPDAAPPTPPNSSPVPEEVISQGNEGTRVRVSALILSSDLLQHCQAGEPTPRTTPTEERPEAVFLPDLIPSGPEKIHEPPIRKRKTAGEAFDEANERRKKARRKGGQGVAAAAAPKPDKQIPSLQHRRSTSTSQIAPLQTRPLSRSPSIASSRPATANRSSALSNVENSASQVAESAVERKNKDILSRIVMTGMRLYGLVQSKKRNARESSSAPSPAVDGGGESIEAQRKADEEYKLIYHQVFKGTCVAFRATIRTVNLQPSSVQVRDAVDQLLVIFCTDPLEGGLGQLDEKLTPGGRKAFAAGSSRSIDQPHIFALE